MDDRNSVELDLFHGTRMNDTLDLLRDRLDQDNDTGDLDTAAGRTGAGSDHHQYDQDTLGKLWP